MDYIFLHQMTATIYIIRKGEFFSFLILVNQYELVNIVGERLSMDGKDDVF